MTLHQLSRNLNGFDITKEIHETIVVTSPAIVKLNQGQMFIGKRSDGTEILPTYSDFTIALKEEKNQPSDRVTLRDTGAFWNSLQVDVNSGYYTIDAKDSKTNKLLKKYGDRVLGLSKESKNEEYIPLYFFPELKSRIENKIGIKMT